MQINYVIVYRIIKCLMNCLMKKRHVAQMNYLSMNHFQNVIKVGLKQV